MTSLLGGDVNMQNFGGSNVASMLGARVDTTMPSTEDFVNVFGPSGYNVVPDANRHQKFKRLHLPDVLLVSRLYGHKYALRKQI